MKEVKKDDYIFFYRLQGINFLGAEMMLRGYVEPELLLLFENNEVVSYLPRSAVEKTKKIGLRLIKNQESLNGYLMEFRTIIKQIPEYKNKFEAEQISPALFDEFINFGYTISKLYSYCEWFYTELLYQEDVDPLDRRKMEDMKQDGRKALNEAFFEPGNMYGLMTRKIARHFNASLSAVERNSLDELKKSLISGQFKDSPARKNRYGLYADNNQVVELAGKDLDKIMALFIVDVADVKEIRGVTANKGNISGKASVIPPIYDDFSQMDALMISMPQGAILVAATTSPELIPACKKAAAIVTDEGGMGSHAAIVSRELNIPCIVGTQFATKTIRDGDTIEVDANKGVVRIIKRYEDSTA